MKKNFKKIMTVVLVGALAASTLTSCGEKEVSNDGTIHITWMGNPNMPVNADSDVEKYLEERYGVEIDVISNTTNYNEKLGAMIAGGDVPDVMFIDEPSTWVPLAKQGILAKIDKEFVKENAPEYYGYMNEYDEKIWDVCRQGEDIYVIPRYTGREETSNTIWRQDWLENVGITQTPETVEEFEQAFVKFRNEDPDGNGKKDTYGLTGMGGHSVRLFDGVFGAFGTMPGQWFIDESGNVEHGTIRDESKKALELLHKWYEMEIIDPEFITDNVTTSTDKFNAGRIGVYFDGGSRYHDSTAVGRANLENWKTRNEKAKFAIGDLPVGANGEFGGWQWGPRTNFVGFSKDLEKEPEKMAVILKMLNDMLTNEEVALRVSWGIEGETYTFVDPEVGSKSGIIFMPPYDTDSNARAEAGLGQAGFFNMLEPLSHWAKEEITEKYAEERTYLTDRTKNNTNYRDAIYRANLASSTLYQSNLDKMKVSEYSKFITGERSLDTWEQFVDEFMKAGCEQMTKEAQEYYDTYIK